MNNVIWVKSKTNKNTMKTSAVYKNFRISYGTFSFKTGHKNIWLIINGELIKNHNINYYENEEETRREIKEYINNNYDELEHKYKIKNDINLFGDGFEIVN